MTLRIYVAVLLKKANTFFIGINTCMFINSYTFL